MKKLICIVLMFTLSACTMGATGDTANDSTAAQSFLPTVSGYTSTPATNVTQALNTVAGGASLLTGNPAVAAAVARMDMVTTCYNSVGAVAANVYTPTDLASAALSPREVAAIGVVAVINQDRLRENFFQCVVQGNDQGFSAQSVEVELCTGQGSATVEGETISYLYVATTPALCSAFAAQLPSG